MVRIRYIAVFLLLFLTLTGCGQQLDPFTMHVEDDNETALQIDLIAVSDNAVGAMLHSAGGAGWFSDKQAFLAGYSGNIAVRHYELVPGYVSAEMRWPSLSDATMFMIAINYPDQPRFMAMDAYSVRKIIVGKCGIEVQT
ncbi:hypothetical protein [Kordiimonas aquimaris]|uniref:hypothetical protein n=1 Tax=Kordiimonas aquimaris TaxID=707591 RepID=UPI0021D05F60|nr:hypothetical protein [Kordiimonas aquimaris]